MREPEPFVFPPKDAQSPTTTIHHRHNIEGATCTACALTDLTAQLATALQRAERAEVALALSPPTGREFAAMRDAISMAEDYLKVSIGIWNDEGVDREVGTGLHRAWALLAGALAVLQAVQRAQMKEIK